MGQRNCSCEPGGGWDGSTCKRKRLSASRAVDTIRWPMRGTAVQSRTGMRDMICAYNVDISLHRSRSQRVGWSRCHELIHAEATGTKPYPPAWTSHTPSDGERKGINLVWEGRASEASASFFWQPQANLLVDRISTYAIAAVVEQPSV